MPVLLLDRDGVLVARRTYDYEPKHMVPLPGSITGLQRFGDAGYRFFVLSNQSGVGRGLQTQESVVACNEALKAVFQEHGVMITECLFCPHTEDMHCPCRKPKTGMWEELRARYGLTAEECLMVGDRPADIALGNAIGCPTALIGVTTEECPEQTYRALDLLHLVEQVLS